MERILIAEDDKKIAQLEQDYLEISGFETMIVGDGAQVIPALKEQSFQLVLLDVMLPNMSGYDICRRIRDEIDIPILMVTARTESVDVIRGLGLGADDYIVKPFLPQELVLRLTAVLRRSYAAQLGSADNVLHLGETVVDWGSGSVTRGGKTMQLTAKEYALLRKLADNRGNIVTIDALCRAAWDDETFGYENTLMVHIRRLREKIEENPSKPRWLLTVRGLGYKLAKEEVQ